MKNPIQQLCCSPKVAEHSNPTGLAVCSPSRVVHGVKNSMTRILAWNDKWHPRGPHKMLRMLHLKPLLISWTSWTTFHRCLPKRTWSMSRRTKFLDLESRLPYFNLSYRAPLQDTVRVKVARGLARLLPLNKPKLNKKWTLVIQQCVRNFYSIYDL